MPKFGLRRKVAIVGSQHHMLAIAVSYAIFALSLLLQPQRWGSTPAYHNLLIIAPQRSWGIVFAVTASLLGIACMKLKKRWLAIIALSVALAVTTTWDAAFVVRWLTSPNTTPETWVSWAVFDYLLLRALMLLGYEEVRIPTRPDAHSQPDTDRTSRG